MHAGIARRNFIAKFEKRFKNRPTHVLPNAPGMLRVLAMWSYPLMLLRFWAEPEAAGASKLTAGIGLAESCCTAGRAAPSAAP